MAASPLPALRTLIVDDEALSRQALRRALTNEPDVEIVGECADTADALERLQALTPDLMFLDIRMPGKNGLEFLQSLESELRPIVVLVTAYDSYALEAFDLHVANYLLKPIDPQRLRSTLDDVRARRDQQRRAQQFDRFLGALSQLSEPSGNAGSAPDANKRYATRLIVRAEGRMLFLQMAQIDYIEAQRNYVRVHADGQVHLIREGLGHLAESLDPRQFVRIHRSTIVNINRIREVLTCESGDYLVVLHDGNQLRMSRSFRGVLDRSHDT